MAWSVILSPEFAAWIDAEPDAVKARVGFALRLLRDLGPQLGRPHADTLHGAGLANLKELRVAVGRQPYRILFAFDPIRRAVILCGGAKGADRRFYARMIPLAEAIYLRHRASIPPGAAPEEGTS